MQNVDKSGLFWAPITFCPHWEDLEASSTEHKPFSAQEKELLVQVREVLEAYEAEQLSAIPEGFEQLCEELRAEALESLNMANISIPKTMLGIDNATEDCLSDSDIAELIDTESERARKRTQRQTLPPSLQGAANLWEAYTVCRGLQLLFSQPVPLRLVWMLQLGLRFGVLHCRKVRVCQSVNP